MSNSGRFNWDVLEDEKKKEGRPKSKGKRKRLVDVHKWKNIQTVKESVLKKALSTLGGMYINSISALDITIITS